ncbi:MAG: aminodeoxychorismate synthase component I, partial [Flavobacteriaceae bacterium]|nr:aminodeoxychorismate synthase component I [Flavobacteriaceae bacterium]
MRTSKKIPLKNYHEIKSKLLAWSQQFDQVVWLDSNEYPQKYSSFEAVLAVASHTELSSDFDDAFRKLKKFKEKVDDYVFGYFSYDLKNDIEDLSSQNLDGLDFPELYFFQPKKLFFLRDHELEVQYLNEYEHQIESDLHEISQYGAAIEPNQPKGKNLQENAYVNVKIHKRITKKQYLKHLDTILANIHRGDIYEVNFCQEFYANDAHINPLLVYEHLNDISSPPFATFFKLKDNYLLSASPERFVRRENNKIISQPIKGTAKRLIKKKLDEKLATLLENDP